MKTIQKIFTIIIFVIALSVLTKVYILPLFQKKSLSITILNSLVQPTSPILENNDSVESTQSSIQLTKTIKKPIATPVVTKNIISDTAPWGVAQQIGEHTWTIKVGNDSVMASPTEILTALNNYRVNHGSQKLTMDSKLSEYAQSRANYFFQKEGLDNHQGFNNFLSNEDGFNKLGFTWVGENASYGYKMNGVHLIEWIYASDEYHDQNQLNNVWNYVGIGVKDTATCLIFATGKS